MSNAPNFAHAPSLTRIEDQSPAKARETVNHPAHYGGGDNPYETIKVLRARLTYDEFVGAMKFNIYKYNDRARQKGCELENYQKAQFYQNALVEYVKENQNKLR